jgi:NAD-dependent SIR2 family protein deacetylase
LSAESGIIDFNRRKTGLFKPVWLADLRIDQPYLLITGKIPF